MPPDCPTDGGVAFFTRILNFKRDLLGRLREQRTQTRYRVGADFPLLVTVALSGDGSAPGCDWNGRVSDLSAGGLSVRLPPAAATARNEATTARISLEGHELAIPCAVAHFRIHPAHALCGLRLEFGDFAVQKAWHQIVEAVSLGASFTPVDGNQTPSVSTGPARRKWCSLKQARLTEWREKGSRKPDRFELILEEYQIEGRLAEPGLAISSRTNPGKAVSPTVESEVRQLFCWVVANMPATVPADLREFMHRAATVPAASTGSTSRSPAAKPPSEWLPPKRPARDPA